ncbi:hypothetical protein TWF696_008572 [Orbilia brochopaga]|uniref:Uncharacterized protein n=1 Tax=Orbilia brochopaga TaxID=3140254 RepID=A0AAV9UHJ2_9PEZI
MSRDVPRASFSFAKIDMRYQTAVPSGSAVGEGNLPEPRKRSSLGRCIGFVKKSIEKVARVAAPVAAPAAAAIKKVLRKTKTSKEEEQPAKEPEESRRFFGLLHFKQRVVGRKATERLGTRAADLGRGLEEQKTWGLPGADGRHQNPLHPDNGQGLPQGVHAAEGVKVQEWTKETSKMFSFDEGEAHRIAKEILGRMADEEAVPPQPAEWPMEASVEKREEAVDEYRLFQSLHKAQGLFGAKLDAATYYAARAAAKAQQQAAAAVEDDGDDDEKVAPVAVRPAGAVACGEEYFLPARLTVQVGRQQGADADEADDDDDKHPSAADKGKGRCSVPSTVSGGDGRASLLTVREALMHVHPQRGLGGRIRRQAQFRRMARLVRVPRAINVDELLGEIPTITSVDQLVRALLAHSEGVESEEEGRRKAKKQKKEERKPEKKEKAVRPVSVGLSEIWKYGEELRKKHGTVMQASVDEVGAVLGRFRMNHGRGKKAEKQREASGQQLPSARAPEPQQQQQGEGENSLHLTISNPDAVTMTVYEMLATEQEEKAGESSVMAAQKAAQEEAQKREDEKSRAADEALARFMAEAKMLRREEAEEKLAQYYQDVKLDHERAEELVDKLHGLHPADIFAPSALKGIVKRRSIEPAPTHAGEIERYLVPALAGDFQSPEGRRFLRIKYEVIQKSKMRQHALYLERMAARQAEQAEQDALEGRAPAAEVEAEVATPVAEQPKAPTPLRGMNLVPYDPEAGGYFLRLPSFNSHADKGKGVVRLSGGQKQVSRSDSQEAGASTALPDTAEKEMGVPPVMHQYSDADFAPEEDYFGESPGPTYSLGDEYGAGFDRPIVDLPPFDSLRYDRTSRSWEMREEDPAWQMLKEALCVEELHPEQIRNFNVFDFMMANYSSELDQEEIEEFVDRVSIFIPYDSDFGEPEGMEAEQSSSARDADAGSLSNVPTRTDSDYQESGLAPSFDPNTTRQSSLEESMYAPDGNELTDFQSHAPKLSESSFSHLTFDDAPGLSSRPGTSLFNPDLDDAQSSHPAGVSHESTGTVEDQYMNTISRDFLRQQAAIANQRITEDSIFERSTNITRRPKIRREIEERREAVLRAMAPREATPEIPLGSGLRSLNRGQPRVYTGRELRPLHAATPQSPTAWYRRSQGGESDGERRSSSSGGPSNN